MTSIGGRLLRARLEFGARSAPPRRITQAEVAAAAGTSQSNVARWETDASEPPLGALQAMADFLGVRAGWLAFGEEPMRREEAGVAALVDRPPMGH